MMADVTTTDGRTIASLDLLDAMSWSREHAARFGGYLHVRDGDMILAVTMPAGASVRHRARAQQHNDRLTGRKRKVRCAAGRSNHRLMPVGDGIWQCRICGVSGRGVGYYWRQDEKAPAV